MKKAVSVCLMIALLVAIRSMAWSSSVPGTGIEGSFHDLSMLGLGSFFGDFAEHGGHDRVCVYCHAPHHSLLRNDLGPLPLWNHTLSTNTIFTMYSNGWDGTQPAGYGSFQSQAILETATAPGPVSLLCLSCHDGSIAVSAYGFFPASSTGSPGGIRMRGRSLIGYLGDFRNHHPIGIDYNYAVALNNELNPPATPLLGFNPYGLTINDVLSYGKIECTSCHDVHNAKSQGIKFTWVEDRRSRLCLSCHRK